MYMYLKPEFCYSVSSTRIKKKKSAGNYRLGTDEPRLRTPFSTLSPKPVLAKIYSPTPKHAKIYLPQMHIHLFTKSMSVGSGLEAEIKIVEKSLGKVHLDKFISVDNWIHKMCTKCVIKLGLSYWEKTFIIL